MKSTLLKAALTGPQMDYLANMVREPHKPESFFNVDKHPYNNNEAKGNVNRPLSSQSNVTIEKEADTQLRTYTGMKQDSKVQDIRNVKLIMSKYSALDF